MPKKIKIDDILRKNPSIRREDLDNNMLLTQKLREVGIQPRGYQLAQPLTRRRAKLEEGEEFDSRTINLSAYRH